MRIIKDDEIVRGNVPMTKFITRTVVMSLLQVKKGDHLIDIGAGTGSVSLQAALLGANVVSIEREVEGIRLIRENQKKFNVSFDVIYGEATLNLPEMITDKCFIGGSGGRLDEIFDYLDRNLREDGILCATFITLENINRFLELLKIHKYRMVETHLVQASQLSEKGLLKGENPVFVVKGVK